VCRQRAPGASLQPQQPQCAVQYSSALVVWLLVSVRRILVDHCAEHRWRVATARFSPQRAVRNVHMHDADPSRCCTDSRMATGQLQSTAFNTGCERQQLKPLLVLHAAAGQHGSVFQPSLLYEVILQECDSLQHGSFFLHPYTGTLAHWRTGSLPVRPLYRDTYHSC